MKAVTSLFEGRFNGIDWNDMDHVRQATHPLLESLAADRALLRQLVENAVCDAGLLKMCEEDAVLVKLVLYSGEGVRLRLHLFKTGGADRAHNHRWTFSSVILRGGYTHVLYRTAKEFSETMKYSDLQPFLIQEEKPGNIYSLHHDMIHTLNAKPGSASLIIRGPAMKERMIIIDKDLDQAWWQYGENNDMTMPERRNKKLTPERFGALTEAFLNEHAVAGSC